MSHYLYWSRVVGSAALTLALLFVVAQSGLAVWEQYQLRREANANYQRAAELDQDKAADEVAKTCSAVPQQNPALRDCLSQEIRAYQKRDLTNKDLQAQQEMAYWTFVAAIVGFLGVAVSTGGVFFVFQSLRQTRQAITNDRRIGEAQVRPYLSARPPRMTNIRSGEPPIAALTMNNTGQSPAYNVRHLSGLIVRPYPLPKNQGDFFYPANSDFVRGMTLAAGADIDIDVELEPGLAVDTFFGALSKSDERIYLAAIVEYEDIFGSPHKTWFCAYLDPIGHPETRADGTTGIKRDWILADAHNGAT